MTVDNGVSDHAVKGANTAATMNLKSATWICTEHLGASDWFLGPGRSG